MLSSSSSSSKTCEIDRGDENSERAQNEEVRKRRPRQSRRRSSSSCRRGLYNYNQIPLLNMAQARREVAIALKVHRAKLNYPQFCPCFNFQPPTLKSREIPNISQEGVVVVVPKSISISEEEEEEEEGGNNKVIMASSSSNLEALALEIHESFHKPIEFPDWLCITDDFLHQTLNSHYNEDDCLQDSDLSRMDIGEIEDVDGDWLT